MVKKLYEITKMVDIAKKAEWDGISNYTNNSLDTKNILDSIRNLNYNILYRDIYIDEKSELFEIVKAAEKVINTFKYTIIEKDTMHNGKKLKNNFIKCAEAYDEKFKKDLEIAFNKFDKDGSGSIDKEELANLSKELGSELTEEQLQNALKDLDLNGDGVIDINEFARWYFSGMKPYSGLKRSLL